MHLLIQDSHFNYKWFKKMDNISQIKANLMNLYNRYPNTQTRPLAVKNYINQMVWYLDKNWALNDNDQNDLIIKANWKLNSLWPMADVSDEAVYNHVDNATKFIKDGKFTDRTNHILWAASDYLTKSSNSIWEWVSDKLKWIANLVAAPVSIANDMFFAPATEAAAYWYKKLYNVAANAVNSKKIKDANNLINKWIQKRVSL